MGTNGKVSMAGRTFTVKSYDSIQDLQDADFAGRVWDKEFALQLISGEGVIVPIVTTVWQGREYLIDGRNRLLHSRMLASMTDEEFAKLRLLTPMDNKVTPKNFQYIAGLQFQDINPADQKVWALVLNEQRSENPIMAWGHMRTLQSQGKWDEIAKMYRFNKARFKRLETLNGLRQPDTWILAYNDGRVAEGTLFAIARLGERQNFLLAKLNTVDKNGDPVRITMADVKEAKTVQVSVLLSSMPALNFGGGAPVNNTRQDLFVWIDMEKLEVMGLMTNFGDAYNARGTWANAKLFRCVEVGQ